MFWSRPMQYVIITTAGVGSMLAGASVVHAIFKPDVSIKVPPASPTK